MASATYTAKIEHTEKTIEQLYRARYHNYEKGRMLVRFIMGLAAVYIALFADVNGIVRGILLPVGAWLLVSLDFPAGSQAEKTLMNRKALLPTMSYVFYPDRVGISGEGSMTLNYKKFEKLAYDKNYFYLFQNSNSICMIDRSTIKPADKDEEFMIFLVEKTGKVWTKEKSFALLNLEDLREILKARKARMLNSAKNRRKKK